MKKVQLTSAFFEIICGFISSKGSHETQTVIAGVSGDDGCRVKGPWIMNVIQSCCHFVGVNCHLNLFLWMCSFIDKQMNNLYSLLILYLAVLYSTVLHCVLFQYQLYRLTKASQVTEQISGRFPAVITNFFPSRTKLK